MVPPVLTLAAEVCVSVAVALAGSLNCFSSTWPVDALPVTNPSMRNHAFSGTVPVNVKIRAPAAFSTVSLPVLSMHVSERTVADDSPAKNLSVNDGLAVRYRYRRYQTVVWVPIAVDQVPNTVELVPAVAIFAASAPWVFV